MNAPFAIMNDESIAASLPLGEDINISSLSKRFDSRSVLKNLNLDIPSGQFLAVIGRSGCGKTTLLRLVSGLEKPSEGSIHIGGQRVTGLQSRTRLLFQDARLLPWQTVIENVGIAREKGWRERAQAVLDDVGLGERSGEWPAVLSGGQRQRVSLARALISDPRVLLLDEPFGALDALTRKDMHELLIQIRDKRPFTTLLITHDVSEALALADRVVVLKDGTVVLDLMIGIERSQRSEGHPAITSLHTQILASV